MTPIQIISQDVFNKIRSRFSNLEMGDETGAVTIDPREARFFDFDFVKEGVDLGRVSISLNDLGSLKIYYSQGITENQDSAAKKLWYSFLKEMRFFARRRLLRFDTRDIAKTRLDKNDFQYLASKAPKEETTMKEHNKKKVSQRKVIESRWNGRSSRKTSRAVKGATEVIVRHHSPVEETYPGARSHRNNIKAIFIQNKDGERFKYPFIHPAGAFAMAQHVDHGGIPHDPAGKAIIRMSEQIAQLQEFQKKVQHQTLHDDATGITERALGRLNELKSCVEALGKRHHYESWVTEFNEQESQDENLTELDSVTMEDYKSKFTQTSFQEDLAKYFPLIHKIMQETNIVNLEEYVEEEHNENKIKQETKNFGPEEQFEDWADSVEQGKLTDDQIDHLKSALSNLEDNDQELKLGPEGQEAWQFFNQFGIEDEDLEEKLMKMADIDPTANPLLVFQAWAQDNYPELLVALGMTGEEEKQPPSEKPAAENDDMGGVGMGTMESADSSTVIKEIAKKVKSFYNGDNPHVGPFRGEEGILLDVEKDISEKFGEEAGKQARIVAEKFMQKLTDEWNQKHGDVGSDGLARLKELAGTIKQRVEELSSPQESQSMAYESEALESIKQLAGIGKNSQEIVR